ncbi:hypothetical protein Nepgr_024478 [Nepenthes gracilis]|uniref:DEK-C domain-containing protein n=1 Tax=Nepenthes gracilis TaxID=150966 RepID=A0AAD3Y038_NEPGR|nr:hypothetical protein Nepgr_024478 [Nepenthes gracilis]
MDSKTLERIEAAVVEILQTADMEQMTEHKVRKLASEKLGIDLSAPDLKRFVRRVVESFLREQQEKAEQQRLESEQQEEEAEEEEEEEEEQDTNRRSDGKEYDDDGDLIICRLSEKRRVTIQDFRGKTLVSMREYYKKDGKELPSSKGISLTAEQWSAFKKNVPAIEKAIRKMEARLS